MRRILLVFVDVQHELFISGAMGRKEHLAVALLERAQFFGVPRVKQIA
jgi:hypothetical protein